MAQGKEGLNPKVFDCIIVIENHWPTKIDVVLRAIVLFSDI